MTHRSVSLIVAATAFSACTGSPSPAGGPLSPPSAAAPAATAAGHAASDPSPRAEGCAYSATFDPPHVDVEGGAALVHISTGPGCAWRIDSDVMWIRPSVTNGTGPGHVPVTVEANHGAGGRAGHLRIADTSVGISQSGQDACQYRVTPVEALAMPLGDRGSFTITTSAACPWTAATEADWVTLRSPLAGSGSATIRYDVSPNPQRFVSTLRETPIKVRWVSATAGQNVWVRQLPVCTILILEPRAGGRQVETLTVGAGGETASLWTLVDPAFSCPWTARSEVSWITVISPAHPTLARGDGSVRFSVEGNNTGAERRGRVEVGEKFVTILQPSR